MVKIFDAISSALGIENQVVPVGDINTVKVAEAIAYSVLGVQFPADAPLKIDPTIGRDTANSGEHSVSASNIAANLGHSAPFSLFGTRETPTHQAAVTACEQSLASLAEQGIIQGEQGHYQVNITQANTLLKFLANQEGEK